MAGARGSDVTPVPAMTDLMRTGVLEEALVSKRAVRDRLVRTLRCECRGSLDASPPQMPIAGATTTQEPLGAYLVDALRTGGATEGSDGTAGRESAMRCESPLAR